MGQNIMILDDIAVRRIQKQHIDELFLMAKACLLEKGIENIREDLLMLGLKNACAKKLETIDFGLFKMNKLIGFAFLDLNKKFFEDNATGLLNTIYIVPEHRTEKNYMKQIDYILDFCKTLGIKQIKTTDNWTLCNDCEVLIGLLESLKHKKVSTYRLER